MPAAYRQLANLGTTACTEQWGVEPFGDNNNHNNNNNNNSNNNNNNKHMPAACRQLANLGTTACSEQWGVEPFGEKHRDTHDFAKRVGRLPEQRDGDEVDYRGLLHRDGSVISAVTLQVAASTTCLTVT